MATPQPDLSTAPPPGPDNMVRFSFTAPAGANRLFVAGGSVAQITMTRGANPPVNCGVIGGYIGATPGDVFNIAYLGTGAPPQLLFV
jgi:hypothetical protein